MSEPLPGPAELAEIDLIASSEKAICERIKLATRVAGNPLLRAVENLPDNLDIAELGMRRRATPGAFVTWLGGDAIETNGAAIEADFAIFVLVENAASDVARRRAAYQIMRLIVPSLQGFRLPCLGALQLKSIRNMYNEALDKSGLSLYAANFSVPMPLQPIDDADRLALLHADWIFRPEDFYRAPLPIAAGEPSGIPRGTDDLTLQQEAGDDNHHG